MTRLRQVAMRIREVQERVQRFEEIELGRMRDRKHDAEQMLLAVQRMKQASDFPQGTLTGNDVQQWSRYLTWVDGSLETSRMVVHQAERQVDEQTLTVKSAYYDARRWRELEGKLLKVEDIDRQRREQQSADDDAVGRPRTGESSW